MSKTSRTPTKRVVSTELSILLLVKEMRLLMMLQMLLSGLNRLEVILIMSLIMKMKKRLQLRRLQQRRL